MRQLQLTGSVICTAQNTASSDKNDRNGQLLQPSTTAPITLPQLGSALGERSICIWNFSRGQRQFVAFKCIFEKSLQPAAKSIVFSCAQRVTSLRVIIIKKSKWR